MVWHYDIGPKPKRVFFPCSNQFAKKQLTCISIQKQILATVNRKGEFMRMSGRVIMSIPENITFHVV
jgi:hypothetical protein